LSSGSRPDQSSPDSFWTAPRTWDIISASGGATSTGLATLAQSHYAAGDFSLSRSGNNLVLSFTPVPVPEPACVTATFAAGLGGAAWLRRRRVRARERLAVDSTRGEDGRER
jgi:hypothetical protein